MAAGEATSSEVESSKEGIEVSVQSVDTLKEMATPDAKNTAMQLERAEEAYKDYAEVADRPSKGEVWIWYLYELCSYFIYTTLVPVLFPFIISQVKSLLPKPDEPYFQPSDKGLMCRSRQLDLYRALTRESVNEGNANMSSLEWTSISWGIGLVLAAPILGSISTHLDYGRNQLLIAGSAIGIGSFFCLPTGFFTVNWIFPPYIAAIIAANIVAAASHTRHLGVMVRRFTGPSVRKEQFQFRRGVTSWLSLYATAAGGVGSAIMSTFTYYMLRYNEKFVSLWVVSIFSGLLWAVGIIYVIFIKPGATTRSTASAMSPFSHCLSIFTYPQALGSLIVACLGSFTSMCIFTSVALYLLGGLCFRPMDILYIWLTYFLVPLVSLPLMHPLQHMLKASTVKMHLLGFLLSIATTGVGFFYRKSTWEKQHVYVFAAIQSTSVGLLHAFERALLVDCTPEGKEGALAAWLSWWKALGTLLGFAVASAMPGNVSRSFGVAFCTAVVGSLVLVYGNINDYGGALAARNVMGEDNSSYNAEKGSLEQKEDTSIEVKKHGGQEEDDTV